MSCPHLQVRMFQKLKVIFKAAAFQLGQTALIRCMCGSTEFTGLIYECAETGNDALMFSGQLPNAQIWGYSCGVVFKQLLLFFWFFFLSFQVPPQLLSSSSFFLLSSTSVLFPQTENLWTPLLRSWWDPPLTYLHSCADWVVVAKHWAPVLPALHPRLPALLRWAYPLWWWVWVSSSSTGRWEMVSPPKATRWWCFDECVLQKKKIASEEEQQCCPAQTKRLFTRISPL